MSKGKQLRKAIAKRGLEDASVLMICTGKHCAPRSQTRPLVEAARRYAEGKPPIVVATCGCLGICKHGPIAASYPKVRIKKRVSLAKAQRMIDKLERRANRSR